MCLAILGPAGDISITFLSEQIWCSTEHGSVLTTEVYDIFFKPNMDGVSRLLVLSPHVLFDGDVLHISAMGRDASSHNDNYDRYYGNGRAAYDAAAGVFEVGLESDHKRSAKPSAVSGLLVVPSVGLPSAIAEERQAIALMGQIGTVCELVMPHELHSGQTYTMRLLVQPHALLNLPPRIPIPDHSSGEEGSWWEQNVQMFDARVVFSNTQQLLRTALMFDEGYNGATAWTRLLKSPPVDCCCVERYRTGLILPRRAALERDHSVGNVMPLMATVLQLEEDPLPRAVYRWEAGTEIYPADHPQSVAELVLGYLTVWGGEGKTKEAISAALNLYHGNCSIIVDALVRHGILHEERRDAVYYHAKGPLRNGLDVITRDLSVIGAFSYSGFEITYAIRYYWKPSHEPKRAIS